MAKKKKDKIESLNAVVSYDGGGELMSDISSVEPLKTVKKKIKKTKKETSKKVVEKITEAKKEKTQKEIYNNILLSGDYFYLKYGGVIVYDSEKDKDKRLIFKNNGFIIDAEDFLYQGLVIKFKK